MFAKIRKAVIAGFGAGVTAFIGALSTVLADGKFDGAGDLGWVVGSVLVAAVTVGWATYRLPNAPVSPVVAPVTRRETYGA